MKKESTFAVTFDVDWAPDWAIALCADMCRAHGAAATFFATHRSDLLEDLKRDPLFEVGIHPNFEKGSSHGERPEEVMEACLDLVPDARTMRTHCLHQSSRLLTMVVERYPTIIADLSLLLPFHPGLRPVDLWLGTPPRRLTRLPYVWEDALVADWPDWNWRFPTVLLDGLCIMNFHPIWVALNMAVQEDYLGLKSRLEGTSLHQAPRRLLDDGRNSGRGAGTYLEEILARHGASATTASTIADQYREAAS